MRDKIKEILDDMGSRIRNPLILSFILVWLYFHWQLVYIVFTIEETVPIKLRLDVLKSYTYSKGWCGMIGWPLLISFLSLIVYYLIAILAQAIKVLLGKRLNAFMLYKFDTGSYAHKSELETERKKNKKLQEELDKARSVQGKYLSENSDLETENSDLGKELNRLSNEYETAKSHIHNNPKFIEKYSNLLVFLLGRANNVEGIKKKNGEILRSHFSVVNGNWEGLYGTFLPQNSGTSLNIIIDNEKVLDFSNNQIGEIIDFSFEKNLDLIDFKLKRIKESPQHLEVFHLIRINRNEMIGLYNDNFVKFKREE